MIPKTFIIKTLDDLNAVSEFLIANKGQNNVIAFYGLMGAGKTTLITNLCQKLGVLDTVNSPTFSIVNEYVTLNNESIFHFDFYRIKKLEEAFDIGYENYFYSDNLCLIEWPELIESLLPERYLKVELSVDDQAEQRKISCSFVRND
ncbi:MAG: tRNA (adenosine(37)-N6)-threonylcarbamoyltransferase complex ATPase subunit type 1 TsaE [Lentimicrobiaceae bacterium]|jgi:tRNA threonylcarbamoyladenosine biosynthesis protein TsaE|nr:tRNA (adenosine(37)-N6)-threonylcarbamoyltransferase complex ATPase subunit type 1 TsaE [Lentimicrobiaceae bacterium]